MSQEDYTNGANLAEGVRVFDDLTRFENSGLECPVLVGDMGGGIGQARLRVLRDVFRGLIEADNAGFPTGGAVFIALQPIQEHVEDAEIHITEEERTAWNKKADASAVAGALAETLQAAKEYADEQARNLADSFAAALETAVSELKEEIRNTVATLIDNAPEALDTLQELSAALGDNPNFATEVATELGKRVTKEALAEELAKYVPKTGDTTIAGTLTATDFRIPESE